MTGTSQTAAGAHGAVGSCFHCDLPIEPRARVDRAIEGTRRAFCCAGCAAAAGAIAGAGLIDYYRLREAPAARPPEAFAESERAYDDPVFQASFVATTPGGGRETALLIEGIRCAACAWLNEQVIRRLPGVEAVAINYTTHRAQVRWDPARQRLSRILAAVERIGYRAFPYDRGRADALRRAERRSALWRLFVAAFAMMQVMMYAFPSYIAGVGGMPDDVERLMRWAGLTLTVPVVVYCAQPFFRGAWRDLAAGRAGMDVPVALGVAIAFAASAWATLRGSGEVYFDSVSMFVFLLLAGRYLELEARQRAAAGLDHLARLVPAMADRLPGFPALREPIRVAVANLRAGDVVLVRPGERLPADGVVVEGEGTVSESLITGESRARTKRAGQPVIGGSINLASALAVRVERVGADTMLAAIVRLAERAMGERHRLGAIADRYAQWFVIAVLALALASALAWTLIEPSRALWIAVSVLVVTCPCALSLATPAALTVATAEMARSGLIVTRGHAIETLARATDVVFDKTGTLTHGEPRIVSAAPIGATDIERCLAVARALETGSEHPIARAFRREDAELRDGSAAPLSTNHPGRGVEGTIDGQQYRLGQHAFCAELGGPLPQGAGGDRSAATVVFLAAAGAWLARFELADTPKPGAVELVRSLERAGKRVHLLSGDCANAVAAAARGIGIARAAAEADPAAKLAYVAALRRTGAIVAMVGDGVNDAPVLAGADVSVALGTGADLAQVHADAVLIGGEPAALAAAIRLARRTTRIVRQNLAWATVYNALAIPAAATGLVAPWLAALGMSASSLAVVLNALRLRTADPRDGAASRRG